MVCPWAFYWANAFSALSKVGALTRRRRELLA